MDLLLSTVGVFGGRAQASAADDGRGVVEGDVGGASADELYTRIVCVRDRLSASPVAITTVVEGGSVQSPSFCGLFRRTASLSGDVCRRFLPEPLEPAESERVSSPELAELSSLLSLRGFVFEMVRSSSSVADSPAPFLPFCSPGGDVTMEASLFARAAY